MINNTQPEYAINKDASDDFNCDHLFTLNTVGLSFIAQFSGGGSPSGVLHIDGSNDGSNWVSVTSKNVTADGSYFIEKADWLYRNARLRYVQTSGTGSVNAQSMTKGF
jgi:hypothetical protein